jgi:hypothetical protein
MVDQACASALGTDGHRQCSQRQFGDSSSSFPSLVIAWKNGTAFVVIFPRAPQLITRERGLTWSSQ